MYLAIDVGGTKTLLGCFDSKGKITAEAKFETPKNYDEWLEELKTALPKLKCKDFKAAGAAITGDIDRNNGVGIKSPNLENWVMVPVQDDLEKLLHCPVIIENDAKVGGLAEANNVKNEFKNVLYITIGTGIGIAYIADGVIDINYGDKGGTIIMLERRGKRQSWEALASGRAIVKRFGKKASDITDKDWPVWAKDFAAGLLEVIVKFSPDVVIIGGGVGKHFNRFDSFLTTELKKYETPLMPLPPLKAAKHPEEAVLYGCYYLAKASYA